jgi:methionyl-tRNA formyltransferase
LKIAFAGTPDFAATILRGLVSSDHEVDLVISQPDTRRGRGRKVQPTPVAELTHSLGLPLRQPARISEVASEISDHDALVVAAYGQILRPDTLYATPEGAWNVHASLLPKYRGAAPIERAIINGEPKTGISIIRMDEGLDTGPVALQHSVEIPPDMSGGELSKILAQIGSEAIVEVLGSVEIGAVTLTEQVNSDATYAARLLDEDLIIGWERSAREVHDLIRALSPHIGARTSHPEIENLLKIWRARVFEESGLSLNAGHIYTENDRFLVGCGTGVLEVLELQMPGAKRLSIPDFLRGHTLSGAFET